MSVTLGDIILHIGADDSPLRNTLGSVEQKASGWVNSLGSKIAVGLGGLVASAVGGATALGFAAFKAGGDLDAAYDTLLIKTGASNEELQKLQKNFKNVFTDIPTQAQPAADVLSTLAQRTTLLSDETEGLAKQLLESARVMGGDAKVNTEAYTRMMGDWSISNEDASETLDKVFVASQNTGIGMDRLMQLAVQFGSPMRVMGFTLDDTIALLSKWEAEGVNTELVMGSLRIAAAKFADEGKPLRESLLASFDAIKNNTDATAALNLGMDTFGSRAGPDMVAAIREGRFAFEDLLTVLQDSDGAIMDTAKSTMDWGEKLTILKNKAAVALEPIGMKLLDMASMVLDKAGPALDWFSGILDRYVVPAVDKLAGSLTMLLEGDIQGALANLFGEEMAGKVLTFAQTLGNFITNTLVPFIQEHGPQIKTVIVGLAAGFAALVVITTVVGWVTGLIATVTALSGAFAAAGGGIAGIVAILGGPVTLVIAAIVAAVALLAAAWTNNWGDIQGKTRAVIEFIQNLIPQAMNFINDFVNGRLGVLSQIFNTAWKNIQLIFQAFQAAFNGDWRQFGELLRQAWDNTWKLMGTIISTSWENIKTVIREGIRTVIDFFTQTDWGEVGRGILQGVADGIRNGLSIIRDAAIAAARAALDAAMGFLDIGSPSKVFAEQVGEPSAEGFGQGFAKRMGEIGTGIGQSALGAVSPMPALAGPGGGSLQFVYNDNRFISMSDELDAERILRPVVERIFRGMRKE